MPIHSKFFKYSPLELCRILPYQVMYRLLLKVEQHHVAKGLDWPVVNIYTLLKTERFCSFFASVRKDIENVCKRADRIIAGEIEIFGTWYPFNSETDWLKDPISRLGWNHEVFCHTAPIQIEGHHDVKYVLEVNKMNHLVDVAVAFHYTQDERYADYLLTALNDWMRSVKPGCSVVCRIVMDLGFRILNLTQILLLCAKNEKVHRTISPLALSVIKEHVQRIKRFSTPRWFKTGNGANHVTGEMIGYIVGALFLDTYGEKQERQSFRDEWYYLMEVLDRTIAPSGAYLEMSSNYARVVTEFLVYFDMILEGFDVDGEYSRRYHAEYYTDRLRSYLYHTTYHGMLTNEGDNDDARVVPSFRPDGEEVDYIFKEYNPLPRESYLDGSRWMFHSDDNNDLFLFTRVGRFSPFREGAGTHAHCDLLSLIMGVRGQMVFIDKGCSFYNCGKEIRFIDQRATSHNLLTIEGREMCKPKVNFYGLAPISKCLTDEVTNDSCHFKGSLFYADIVQERSLDYKVNRLTISDSVSVLSSETIKITLHYLLHPDVKVKRLSNHELCLSFNSQSIHLMFEGIEDWDMLTETYSPSFSVVRNTLAIVARGIIVERQVVVRTIIDFSNTETNFL